MESWVALGSNGAGNGALNRTVYSLAISGDQLYAGGAFTDAAGIAEADFVARWDGRAWSALGSNGAGNGALSAARFVDSLAIAGNDLYVGGDFTNIAGIAEADYIARWDGRAWSALGSNGAGKGALNGPVHPILARGSDLYVGGGFTNAAGIAQADYLARWDGNAWSAVSAGTTGTGALNGVVSDIALAGSDLYVAGAFKDAAGIAEADYLARWDGGAWSSVGVLGAGGAPLNDNVYSLAVEGTDLYVGGGFTDAGGVAEADYVAKWNGNAWSGLGSDGTGNEAINRRVNNIALSGGAIYAAGQFTNAAGIPQADYVAKWDGSAWSALGSNGTGRDGALNVGDQFFGACCVLRVAASGVYIGGTFTNGGDIAEADYLVRWQPAGSTAALWLPIVVLLVPLALALLLVGLFVRRRHRVGPNGNGTSQATA